MGAPLRRLAQRLYPNLRPCAELPPEQRKQIYRLYEWYGRFGMRDADGRGHYVPNARYLFVRLRDGGTLVHPRLRHGALAGGAPVLYAGEVYFVGGTLRWWSNGSGHYRPDAGHAGQAGLPMDLFRTWDDVIRRGMQAM